MSGGAYDYAYSRIHDFGAALALRHKDKPHVMAFSNMVQQMADVAYRIEWADSGDTSWSEELDQRIRELVSPQWEASEALRVANDALRNLNAAIDRAKAVHP